MPRHIGVQENFVECDECGSGRHLVMSVPLGGKEKNLCIVCLRKCALTYTRFVATAKNRSYSWWYGEREKLRKSGLSSGLEIFPKLRR